MSSLDTSLNRVRDLIHEATKADSQNDGSIENKLDIYQKYIRSVKEIFSILNEDLEALSTQDKLGQFRSIQTNHLNTLKLSENCIDRLIMQISDDRKRSIHCIRPSVGVNMYQTGSMSRSSNSLPIITSIDVLLAEKPVNPIDSAKCNIRKLVNATNTLLKSNKFSLSERASIQLRINRQIEESLSIARKQEEKLCILNSDSLEQFYRKIDNDINRYRFIRDNVDFPDLYKNSQLFYHHILKDSRTYSMIQSYHSPEVSCMSFILKMNNIHPVVTFINRKVNFLMNIPLNKENEQQFLNEMKVFKETIENLSKLCCLIINTSSKDNISTISSKLTNLLFDFILTNSKLYTFIFNFFFTIYDKHIVQYDKNVRLIEDDSHFSVLLPKKFQNHPEIISILDQQVMEFSSLRDNINPLKKIDLLCHVVTDLMTKIHCKDEELEIGADELVPILIYMMVKFKSAELFLHGKYLELLLPDEFLIGMEGYMLVSIICAMTVCVSETFHEHVLSDNC